MTFSNLMGQILLLQDSTTEILSLCRKNLGQFSVEELSTILTEISKIPYLAKLDLSDNNLTVLPSEIGLCTSLEILDVRINNLTDIPEEIGNLVNLEVLDLTLNKLNRLPVSIVDLKKINQINNNLSKKACIFEFIIRELGTIYVGGNPLQYPPMEIIDRGWKNTITYLDSALVR